MVYHLDKLLHQRRWQRPREDNYVVAIDVSIGGYLAVERSRLIKQQFSIPYNTGSL
ncbi:MAG: hypothetical protein V7K50_22690 [Nostoc sp.]|uniref:hypothetical protein n=1 Tax=Nostoc sp. TaxID=1180 RepID=UPI002FF79A03